MEKTESDLATALNRGVTVMADAKRRREWEARFAGIEKRLAILEAKVSEVKQSKVK